MYYVVKVNWKLQLVRRRPESLIRQATSHFGSRECNSIICFLLEIRCKISIFRLAASQIRATIESTLQHTLY